MSDDDQVRRLARNGAIISANPYYVTALADRYAQAGLGAARANTMVRLGTAVRDGVNISLHSDMPMAPPDPLMLAWAAVNRTTLRTDRRTRATHCMRARRAAPAAARP